MKILLSVFACEPNIGSEGGVGWDWALRLARDGHQVVVLTDLTRYAAIKSHYQGVLPHNPRFVFFRAPCMRWIPLNAYSAQALYHLWQFSLIPMLKQLHAEHHFDYAHHLTYGVFRHPSFLWMCGAPFVFGPLGGGEVIPVRLRPGLPLKNRLSECLRDVANLLARCDPFLQLSLRRAKVIFARTHATFDQLPTAVHPRTVVQNEIGTRACRVNEQDILARAGTYNLKILFAGRLLGWKGLHLALPAFAKLLAGRPGCEFHIVGQGPMETRLRKQCAKLGIEHAVRFHGRIGQDALFSLYAGFDCLLFPSMRDSGGNVVVESLSFGLPVICLNLGGPPYFVNQQCGRVVAVAGRGVAQVVDGLTAALYELSDPVVRRRCALGALRRAGELSWDKQYHAVLASIQEHIGVSADEWGASVVREDL